MAANPKPRRRSGEASKSVRPADPVAQARVNHAYLVEQGIPRETAAAAEGVDPDVYASWLEDPAFERRVRQAEARAECKLINALMTRAIKGSDRGAITFLLERRFPARWDKRVTTVLEEEFDGVLGRIEALADDIGKAAVNRVLEAVAGDDGGPAATDETGEIRH